MWNHIQALARRHPLVATSVLAGLAIALFIGIYAEAPWWMDSARLHTLGRASIVAQHAALDQDRSQVLKIVAGFGALLALMYTARRHSLDRRAHALNEQSQITDRYIKAVEQLGSSSTDVRLGGIYALGRIANDSSADRRVVAEVLAAYLRNHSGTPQPAGSIPAVPASDPTAQRGTDVGAALAVLARGGTTVERRIDLKHTDLSGMEVLSGDGLTNVNLACSNLYRINWVSISLVKTNFFRANLDRAGIIDSDFTDAHLVEANMSNGLFHESSFARTWFLRATLDGSNLLAADLSKSRDLTAEQLSTAGIGPSTQLPPSLQDDPWVLARLRDCATWAVAWNWDSLAPPPPTPRPAPPTP